MEQAPPGFTFDPSSGYFYSAESGMYYDAKSSGFYSGTANKWYSFDAATQQYVEWPDAAAGQIPQKGLPTAQWHCT